MSFIKEHSRPSYEVVEPLTQSGETPTFYNSDIYSEMPAEEAQEAYDRLKADPEWREKYVSQDAETVKQARDLIEAINRQDALKKIETEQELEPREQRQARFDLAQLENNKEFMDVILHNKPGAKEYTKYRQQLVNVANGYEPNEPLFK